MSDVRERMQEVARAVQAILPPGTGFVLLAFDFGAHGRLEYVANASRKDVVEMLEEFIGKAGRPENYAKHLPDKIGLISPDRLATDLQQIINDAGYTVDRRDLIKLLQTRE